MASCFYGWQYNSPVNNSWLCLPTQSENISQMVENESNETICIYLNEMQLLNPLSFNCFVTEFSVMAVVFIASVLANLFAMNRFCQLAVSPAFSLLMFTMALVNCSLTATYLISTLPKFVNFFF